MQLKRVFTGFLCGLCFSSWLAAQQPPLILPDGVLLGGSLHPITRAPSRLPSNAIFVIKGAGLGPDELVSAGAPLPTLLPEGPEAVRVQFRSAESGETADALLLHVWHSQISGVAPESLPDGPVEITVFRGALASEPVTIEIGGAQFGPFTVSQSGTGHAIGQIYRAPDDLPLQSLTNPVRPGDRLILWGTGIPPANPFFSFTRSVRLGGVETVVEYAGDAPGFPGLDQINVLIPADAELPSDCYAELEVQIGNSSATSATIATGAAEGPCDHPWGLSAEQLAALDRGERIQVADLSAGISQTPAEEGAPESTTVNAFAFFGSVDAVEVARRSPTFRAPVSTGFPLPACSRGGVFTAPGPPRGTPNAIISASRRSFPHFDLLDVGDVTLTPLGADPIALEIDPIIGRWRAEASAPGAFGFADWTWRTSGGGDVAALEHITPLPLTEPILPEGAIVRGEDLVITWAADALDRNDQISLSAIVVDENGQGEGVICGRIDTSAGELRIPGALTATIPESPDGEVLWRWQIWRGPEAIELPGFDYAARSLALSGRATIPIN